MKITLEHEGEKFSIENNAITAGYVIGSFLRLMRASGWSEKNINECTGDWLDSELAWYNGTPPTKE